MYEMGHILSAIVTILALLLYSALSINVGRMRVKHKIAAPATSGHVDFDRAYRVQMNTLEQMMVFLPLLWLATIYFQPLPGLPAACGLIWLYGRLLYARSYMKAPERRGFGFGINAIMHLLLLILSIAGIGRHLIG